MLRSTSVFTMINWNRLVTSFGSRLWVKKSRYITNVPTYLHTDARTYERASDILLIAHVGTIGDGSGMCYDTIQDDGGGTDL